MADPLPLSVASWLDTLPRHETFHQISAQRQYAHAEDQYDSQYGLVSTHPEEGLGLCALLRHQALDDSGPAIEIGCGSGFLTTGLAQGYPGEALVITDPSPSFVRLTRNRVESAPHTTRTHYAILNGDDLGLLPPNLFSLIALRSTLHHILDVEGFIGAAGRALRSGGTLAMCAEPCESGYVLMGAVAQSIVPTLTAAGISVKPEWQRSITLFTDTVRFYCRRDFDKQLAEDKHVFRVHELSAIGAGSGLTLRYFPNASFADFQGGANPPPSHAGFSAFFLMYLRYCMSFEVELVELISVHLKSQLEYLDDCYRSHPGPLFTGVFLFVKDRA